MIASGQQEAVDIIDSISNPDVVITLGAGDVTAISDLLTK